MFRFIKKIGKKNDKSVCYDIDKKSMRIIEKYMKKMKIDNITLGELLYMLGFNFDDKLYLRLNKEDSKMVIYYSYENGNFNRFNKIYFDNSYINVLNKDTFKEFFITSEGLTNRVCLENKKFVKRKNINGIEYYISLYNKEFSISIKDNVGKEIKFSCDGIKDKDKILELLNDSTMLENFVFNIRLSDSLEEVFKKWIDKLLEIGFVNFSLSYIKDKEVVSSYLINNYNGILKVMTKNYFKSVYYERIITKKEYDMDNIKIVLKNGDYQFEIEYLDNPLVRDIVNNEMGLVEYLNNLSFPIEMEDVCRNICNVSLGNINRYEDISLKVYRNDMRTNVFRVKEGKLNYFQKIDGCKRITISNDGIFSYTNGNEFLSYLVELDGDVVTKYEQLNEDGMYTSNNSSIDMDKLIEEARDEKVRTRKLIDGLIKV